MKLCKQCGDKIFSQANINGHVVNCSHRLYCFKCSPFGERTKNQRATDLPSRVCIKCKLEKPTNLFRLMSKKSKRKKLHSKCINCLRNEIVEKQRLFKQRCIDYRGGKCIKCGYSKYMAVLEFHHRDPKEKDFNLSRVRNKLWDLKIERELDKCDILCANCHREMHIDLAESKNPVLSLRCA